MNGESGQMTEKLWGAIIGGKFTDSPKGDVFAVQDPATGRDMARVQSSTPDIVDQAVRDSRRAFDTDWRHRSPRERADLLRKVAARIREHVGELAAS